MSSSAPSGGGPPGSVTYPYSLSFQSNASVAIIIVVLGATFFFMFLFVIYIRRCNTDSAAELDGNGGGTNGDGGGWGRQQMVHGLDPEVLEKFPIMRYASVKGLKKGKDGLECAVCLGQFEENEQLRLLPACGHLFHPECIDMWLQTHSTCPLCRRSLSRDAVSGHLQRALAAVMGYSNSNPQASPEAAAAAAAAAAEPDLEAGGEGRDADEGSGPHRDILRALSRNSESFKIAAHEVAVREVRDKLRASSSARFGSPARLSSLRTTPSRSRREGSMNPDPSPCSNLADAGGETPMTPIACGMHHSQSYSDLHSAATLTNSPLESSGPAALESPWPRVEAGASSDRWAAFSSLRRSASTSSSSRGANFKLWTRGINPQS